MSEEQGPTGGIDLIGLGKVANSKVALAAYDDGIKETLKELSGASADVVKTARHLLNRGLALTRARGDRLFDWLESEVPQERRRDAPPEIAIPSLGGLSVVEDTNPLADLFKELLKKAIDNSVPESDLHPAFPTIIAQLSPAEARIMSQAKQGWMIARTKRDSRTIELGEPNISQRARANNLDIAEELKGISPLSFEHLVMLNLITWAHIKGEKHYQFLIPTSFGRAFISVCVPGEERIRSQGADAVFIPRTADVTMGK